MQQAIISIGVNAAKTLRTATQLHVVGTFERSFYLRSGDAFVCVGEPSIGNGPLNALVDDHNRLVADRYPGETVRLADDTLQFSDGTLLTLTEASSWTMPPWPDYCQTPVIATLDMLLARSPADGLFRLCTRHILGSRVENMVPSCQSADVTALQSRTESSVKALLNGLVPSRIEPDLNFVRYFLPSSPLEGEDNAGSIFVLHENRSGPREVGGGFASARLGTIPPTPALPLKGGGREKHETTTRVPPLHPTEKRLVEILRQAVSGLIGLGPGLTPSGDDVLAGVLLGLHATGNTPLAAELGALVAAASVSGTSPLSAAFLHCAIGGETSDALHQVFSAVLTNADWPAALDTIHRIGHTSGWDHLAGFLLAVTADQLRPRS